MNKATLALTLALSSSLIGCATDEAAPGRSAARVSEVEKVTTSGGITTIDRLELSYDGAHLSQVYAYRNGAPNGTARISYLDGQPLRIDYTDKEGDRAFTTFQYIDGSYLWKTHDEVTGVITQDRTVWYDEKTALVKELSYAQGFPGATPHNWSTRYSYDSKDRMSKLSKVDGETTETSEIRYNNDGRIGGMSDFTGTQHNETWDFRYTEDGLLDEIRDTHNRVATMSYSDEGLISDIRVLDGSTSESVRYTYDDGKVEGITFAPEIPVGTQFDLRGKSFDDLALLHIAPPAIDDIPHVTVDP